jgi:murein DD-endopeptidase MepM/ murein hydrolase activator NlpD
MEDVYRQIAAFLDNLMLFVFELTKFLLHTFHLQFIKFETHKGNFVTALYKQRGKLAQKLMHSGMAGITALGVMIAPIIAQELPGRSVDPWNLPSTTQVLSASIEDQSTATVFSDKLRGETIDYAVQEGDTVSTIAQKFGVSEDTIRWENDLKAKDQIKIGQSLKILPVTGVSHKVKKGDTVHSIAKYYDTSAQSIVDFPFNSFANDETFELAVGQTIIVPEGIKPAEVLWQPLARNNTRQTTPDAGTVVASGSFVWPTQGTITQNYSWFHKGIDVANKSLPPILAADSGTVVAAGWDSSGYGNKVIIDHGNGTRTLYGHMTRIYVIVGQRVARGNQIGQMGSTGRSTGPHLHFEVIRNGVYLSPLGVLK